MKHTLKALWNRVMRRKEIDLIVREMSYDKGDFNLVLEHPGFTLFAQEIGKMMRTWKAPNFLETTLFDVAMMRQYTITIQDKTRPTPMEVIRIMRRALEDIADNEGNTYSAEFGVVAQQTAAIALNKVGYLEEPQNAE